MAGTTRDKLEALVTLLGTCAGVQEVVRGMPLGQRFQRTVSVTVIEGPVTDRTAGKVGHERRFLVVWLNSTDGNVEAAELDLCDFLDDIRAKWIVRRRSIDPADALRGMTFDDSLANSPEYRPMAGDEARAYPLVLGIPETQSSGV